MKNSGFSFHCFRVDQNPVSVNSPEKGFVTVSFILLTPFLFVLVFGTLWSVWFINQKHQFDNLCYESVLRSQKILMNQNEKLLALNPQAKLLILRKKALNVLILTGSPSVRAAAVLKKKAVIMEQKSLKLKQKTLFYRGAVLSRSELFQLRTRMNKHFKGILRLWSQSRYRAPGFKIQWRDSQLEVAISDIAPVYRRGRNHSKSQTHKVVWSVPLKSTLPDWIRRVVPVGRRWTGHCESHPHKGGLKWYSAMGEGRHSLRSLSSVFF